MKSKILLIGSGWRAEYFLSVSRIMPEMFDIYAVVTTNKDRAALYKSWGFNCYSTLDDALAVGKPDYAIVSVAAKVSHKIVIDLIKKGISVLDETPAASSPELLHEMHTAIKNSGAKFQMAEQYHMRPDHSARKFIIDSGVIGTPVQSLISLTNTYHSISLLRFYLGTSGDKAAIKAQRFMVAGMPGHGRNGPPEKDTPTDYAQTLATFDFDGKIGIYDFEDAQHRSYIRTQRILIKGSRGVIDNNSIKYLLDYKTPMESQMLRRNRGEDENCEGTGLKGIIACEKWAYVSPFPDIRLNDDEIAVAECMLRMAKHCSGGPSFYSFAEAAQDTYLSQLMAKAVESGETVHAEIQPWTEQLMADVAAKTKKQ